MSALLKTNEDGFYKDPDTGAVLNQKTAELDAYLAQREKAKRDSQYRQEVDNLKQQFDELTASFDSQMSTIKSNMDEIKQLIVDKLK